MTEEQFEEVFYRAQELQTEGLERNEVETSEKALMGFEVKGARKFATITQAAYIINVISMDMAGEYEPNVLNQIRELYLENVTIIDESKKDYIEKETFQDIEVGRNENLENIKSQLNEWQETEIIKDEEGLRTLDILNGILNEPNKDQLKDNNWKQISIEKGLTITEVKGDVIFSEDSKGIKYQQLGGGEPYKVRNGSMTYSEITKLKGHTIKYNNNGIHGFAIFRGRECLEKGYWIYDEVLSRIYEIS